MLLWEVYLERRRKIAHGSVQRWMGVLVTAVLFVLIGLWRFNHEEFLDGIQNSFRVLSDSSSTVIRKETRL
jgi:hypothetical protein